jgi:hypothetical protein
VGIRLALVPSALRGTVAPLAPLRYSINITLDGCCDHRAGSTDEELHRCWAESLGRAEALLVGRVTYEMMEAAWRGPGRRRDCGDVRGDMAEVAV